MVMYIGLLSVLLHPNFQQNLHKNVSFHLWMEKDPSNLLEKETSYFKIILHYFPEAPKIQKLLSSISSQGSHHNCYRFEVPLIDCIKSSMDLRCLLELKLYLKFGSYGISSYVQFDGHIMQQIGALTKSFITSCASKILSYMHLPLMNMPCSGRIGGL